MEGLSGPGEGRCPAPVPLGPACAGMKWGFTHQLARLCPAHADQDLAARGYVKGLMREAGLDIREDTIGNIYGRLPGTEPGAPAIGTGSHCDAIPLAGAFDGTLGELRPWVGARGRRLGKARALRGG